jgi:ABC-type antimicrobial peptide transport system ATPase subunit
VLTAPIAVLKVLDAVCLLLGEPRGRTNAMRLITSASTFRLLSRINSFELGSVTPCAS